MEDKDHKCSAEYAEEQASKKNIPRLKAHITYATKVYNILCKTNMLLEGKGVNDISYSYFIHQVLIAKISDFTRPISLLSSMGYVDQAATLAASVFELSHTLLYIGCDESRAQKWKEADTIDSGMPRKVFNLSWASLVECNKKTYDNTMMNEHEYNIYQQLCWMKHSLPMLQGMNYDQHREAMGVRFAPFDDENAIRMASFSLMHSGRYGQLAVASLLLNHVVENSEMTNMQAEASILRTRLNKEDSERYGDESPFKKTR